MPEAGIPESVLVDALKLTPEALCRIQPTVGVEKPVAVTENEPEVLRMKVVLFALVMAGA